jgi:hypothetical protein
LPTGTLLGRYNEVKLPRLQVIDEQGRSVADAYLRYEDGAIRLASRIMPSMLTLDKRVIRQDCLCYFMERMAAAAS